MTVQELLTDAMMDLGIVAAEEVPSPSELTDALRRANGVLGSWSAQVLPITPLTQESFPLSGAASYTIGTGGVMNTPRPVKIESLAVISIGGARKPVHICTVEEWEALMDTTATGLFADNGFYDGGFPLGKISLLPRPNNGSLEIQSYKQLASLANLTDTINLPPGYDRALRLALAFDMAPGYGRPVTPELAQSAQDAKISIAGLNQAILGKPSQVEPTPAGVPGQAAA